MKKAKADAKPFFVWHNTTLSHVWSFSVDASGGSVRFSEERKIRARRRRHTGESKKTLVDCFCRRFSMAKNPDKPPLTLVGPSTIGIAPSRQLGEHGLALWNRIQAEYRIDDAGGIELLAQRCAAADRAEALPSRSPATARWCRPGVGQRLTRPCATSSPAGRSLCGPSSALASPSKRSGQWAGRRLRAGEAVPTTRRPLRRPLRGHLTLWKKLSLEPPRSFHDRAGDAFQQLGQ
jgi:hypothetical protein